MMATPPPVRLLQAAMRLYPARFRDAYGADLVDDFSRRWRQARSHAGRAALFSRTLINVCVTAVAERRRSSFDGSLLAVPAADRSRGQTMTHIVRDLRHASRSLAAQPAFTLFLLLTLAVGIGATTAVFSVVRGVLLKPLPFADSDRLLAVWGRFDPESGFNFPRFVLSPPEVVDYRREAHTLSDLAAFRGFSTTVAAPGAEPERVPAAAVSANLFSVLRVSPAAGRTFTADEDRPNGPRVALISSGYWKRRFGSDPSLVGRTVAIDRQPTTIVGVLPPGFTYPGSATDLWVPLGIDPAATGTRKQHSLRAIARLADGVTIEQARADLNTIMASWKVRYPDVHTGHYLFIRPLLEDVSGGVRPALTALLVATGFVLLIVCANVAGLLMSRGEARTREMSIRAALGASRAELIRLTLTETALLSMVGGAAGVLLAWAGVRALLAVDPTSVPRSVEVGMDLRVVAFAVAISALTAVISGLLPAFRGSAAASRGTLRESSQATTSAGGRQRVRRALVAAEVAVGVVLVLGAGLMLRGFGRLLSVDPGFRPDGLMTASVAPPEADFKTEAQVEAFYTSVIDRVRAAPGVTAMSAVSNVPLWDEAGVWDFEIEGRPRPAAGQLAWNAAAVIARPGLAQTLGIPMKRGRFVDAHDDLHAAMVTVISDAMAATFFPGEDPVGRRIRVAGVTAPEGWMTIVGIAGDIRDVSLDAVPRPTYYMAQTQIPKLGEGPIRGMSFVMRVDGRGDAAVAALRAAVQDVDPRLPLFDVLSLDTILQRSVARPRFTTTLLAVFALVGILLGASGIYGVLAFTVAARTSEIGIRRALGAPTNRLIADIMRGGLVPVAAGLAIGLLASYWTTRMLTTELYGISSMDPVTYAVAIVAVGFVAIVSCLVPARRALRVSPLIALRSQ